jgi:hypothetical protein
MESAMKRLSTGKDMIGTLPPWLIQEFTDLGVLKEITENEENTDLKKLQKKFPHGLIGFEYNHKINKNIKKSYFLYEYLERQIEIANEFYKTIVTKLDIYNNVGVKNERNEKVTLADLQELHGAMGKLVIQPEISGRRMIEKALGVNVPHVGVLYKYEDEDSDESPKEKNKKISKKSEGDKDVKVEKGGRKRLSSASEDSLQTIGKSEGSSGSAAQLLSLQSKSKDKSYKKGKSSLPNCANKLCTNDVSTSDSTYCSDFCANETAKELLDGMLLVREQLCMNIWLKYNNTDERTDDVSTDNGVKNILSNEDIHAFESRICDSLTGVKELSMGLMKKGFIYDVKEKNEKLNEKIMDINELNDDKKITDISNNNKMIANNENSGDSDNKGNKELNELLSLYPSDMYTDDKKKDLNPLQSTVQSLPYAAYSLLLRESDQTNTTTSPRNIPPQVVTPPVDQDIRTVARFTLEDIFMTSLIRSLSSSPPNSFFNLGVMGMVAIGAVLALEIEHEMFSKYVLTIPGSIKKDYNKKDYRQHYLMLMRNLKQKHNDFLILKIAQNEITTDQLLSMSADELADSNTQLMRQREIKAAAAASQTASMSETLEARRREVEYMYMNIYVYLYIFIYICIYIFILFIHVDIYLYMYLYIYMYIYIYIYIYVF